MPGEAMATSTIRAKETSLLMATATKTGIKFACAAVSCLCSLLAATQVRAQTPVTSQDSRSQAPLPASPSLPISFGDLIQVSVFDNPDLSGPLRVDSNGNVELPLGGSI